MGVQILRVLLRDDFFGGLQKTCNFRWKRHFVVVWNWFAKFYGTSKKGLLRGHSAVDSAITAPPMKVSKGHRGDPEDQG